MRSRLFLRVIINSIGFFVHPHLHPLMRRLWVLLSPEILGTQACGLFVFMVSYILFFNTAIDKPSPS